MDLFATFECLFVNKRKAVIPTTRTVFSLTAARVCMAATTKLEWKLVSKALFALMIIPHFFFQMLTQLYKRSRRVFFLFFLPLSHFPAVSSAFRLRGQTHLLLRRIRHSARDAKSWSPRQLVFHQVSLIRHRFPRSQLVLPLRSPISRVRLFRRSTVRLAYRTISRQRHKHTPSYRPPTRSRLSLLNSIHFPPPYIWKQRLYFSIG